MRVKGHITIISSMSLALIISLILVCFQSAYDSLLNTYIKQASMLSAEAVFAAYDNALLDEFDLLLLEKSDIVDEKLNYYLKSNIKESSKDISIVSTRFDDFEMATDNGGSGIRNEIVAYMKYGAYSEIVDSFKNSEEQVKRANTINEITENIIDCEEKAGEIDVAVLKIISAVEGLETTESGISIKNGKPVGNNDYFVKAVVNSSIDMDSTNVNNQKVFKAMRESTPGYINISVIFDDMIEDAEGLQFITDEESNQAGSNSYASIYSRNYRMLYDAISGALNKIDVALEYIDDYEVAKTGAITDLNKCKKDIEDNRSVLGEELYKTFSEDLSDMREDVSSDSKIMCDVDAIKKALLRNQVILEQAGSYLAKLDVELKHDNCTEVKANVVLCKAALLGISNEGLSFDYSNIDFSDNSVGLSAIKKIKKMLSEGLISLVVDTNQLSQKNINYSNLASTCITNYKSEKSKEDELIDTVLVDEYIMSKFTNYTDFLDKNEANNAVIDYEVEYILCGKKSDKENLEQVIIELSGVRAGLNLAYLLTDTQKKTEALTLASSLLGFTGNMAVIKSGQYLILSAWAYGEAVIDLRNLLAGKRIPLTKNKSNWSLSLNSLLSLRFESDKEGSTGLKYQDYLRMLLLIEDTAKKNYRIMSVIEMRMIAQGRNDFRLKNYIVKAEGIAVFRCSSRKILYSQKLRYSYV